MLGHCTSAWQCRCSRAARIPAQHQQCRAPHRVKPTPRSACTKSSDVHHTTPHPAHCTPAPVPVSATLCPVVPVLLSSVAAFPVGRGRPRTGRATGHSELDCNCSQTSSVLPVCRRTVSSFVRARASRVHASAAPQTNSAGLGAFGRLQRALPSAAFLKLMQAWGRDRDR